MVEFKEESMQNLQFHPLAELEADEASLYYEAISLPISRRFLADLTKSLKNVLQYPQGYPLEMDRVRKLVFAEFPYSLFYAHGAERLYILAVAHHSRHPDYWKPRLKDMPE